MRLASIEAANGTAGEMPPRRSIVRRAEESDLVRMLPCAERFFEAAKVKGTFNTQVWLSYWEQFFRSGCAIVFLCELGDEIIGGIGGYVYPDMQTGEKTLVEAFWFVLPEWRGQGLKLFRTLENWAIENRVSKLVMAHFVHLQAEQLNRLYISQGFVAREVTYVKWLGT